MSNRIKISGNVLTWDIGSQPRKYLQGHLPFGILRKIVRPYNFSSKTGRGEQRGVIESQVRSLGKEMNAGNYTPTDISIGLRRNHIENLCWNSDNTAVELTVDADDKNHPLPLLDGLQRMTTISRMFDNADDATKKLIEDTQIPFVLYLDGETRTDFLNVNQGKSIDKSHIFSLRSITGNLPAKDAATFRSAYDIAKMLQSESDSPFKGLIKFGSADVAVLPINSLCSKGASDVGTSLIGLVRMGQKYNMSEKDLVNLVMKVWHVVSEGANETTVEKGYLSPPPEGTKGAAGMIIGLATLTAFRQAKLGLNWEDAMIKAVKANLSGYIDGSFSSQDKRALLRNFAEDYLAEVEGDRYHELPMSLFDVFTPSAFGLPKFPKEEKEISVNIDTDVTADASEVPTEETPF